MIPQIIIITPIITKPHSYLRNIKTLKGEDSVAAVIFRFPSLEEAILKEYALELNALALDAEIMPLIETNEPAHLVDAMGFEGFHLTDKNAPIDEALSVFKPDKAIGIGSVDTRHDAMELGERDLDYIMFGTPSSSTINKGLDTTIELVKWWSDIFSIPSIAYAPNLESVADLTNTGADFIALGEWVFANEDNIKLIQEAKTIIAQNYIERN